MTWKRRMLYLFVALNLGCASTPLVIRMQQSHDWLALAQDTEAQLCWNVPSVAAAIAANVTANHCTAPTAATIGLTDARHQAFNAKLVQAIQLHASVTKAVQAGANPDTSALIAAVANVLAEVNGLTGNNPLVAQLLSYLQKAKAL